MISPTPIRRHLGIVSFSREHHFGLLLVWKIRQGLKKAVQVERISNYVLYFFRTDLEKHFNDEEAMLFSKLPPADSLRTQAEQEHAEIRRLITAIEQTRDNPTLLNQFAEELENHIRFEERELFNHLQNTVGQEELELIESRIALNEKDIDEGWVDVFWTHE